MTRRLPTVARALAGVVAVTVVSAGLTGCASERLGTAAQVGDERISVEDLQQETRDFLAAAPGTEPGVAQRNILQSRIVSQVIEEAAEEVGATVSDGEVASQRDQLLGPLRAQARQQNVAPRVIVVRELAKQQNIVAPSGLDRFVRDQLLFQAIAERAAPGASEEESAQATTEALVAASRELDVEVNPRYGRWNAERGLEAQVGGGLSKSVEELTSPSPEQPPQQ